MKTQMATKNLYHYTAMLYLPVILRDGIKPGELPVDPMKYNYAKCPKAVNLTLNGNATEQQKIWAKGSVLDKTRIRLTVAVPEKELVSFRKMRETYKITAEVLDLLAPKHVRQDWFYRYGQMSPDAIVAIELLDGGEYRKLSCPETTELVQRIEAEIDRALELRMATSGYFKGVVNYAFKPGVLATWLFDATAKSPTE